MVRAMNGRHRVMAGVIAAVIGLAVPAFAQSTGMVKGKVTDAKNQPVDGAKVVIEFKEGVTRKFEVKTNKKGEYIQIGLQPGMYAVTATKEGVGTGMQETKISIGATQQVDITLQSAAAGGGSLSKEEEAFRKLFTEGVEANKAGKHDESIAKFTEALKNRPDCYACQYNIGGSPEVTFNQGVTLWNAGKIAEAKAQFEAAVKAKPDYADAHYWVGMANLNEGKMPEAAAAFEAYLKHAPTGQYADSVKKLLPQIKPQ
jgi:TolA-binding protein